jgi:hypothetical protein
MCRLAPTRPGGAWQRTDGRWRRLLQARPDTEWCAMFVFFSNRLGCLGSIVVSLLLSVLLIALVRGCSGGSGTVTL